MKGERNPYFWYAGYGRNTIMGAILFGLGRWFPHRSPKATHWWHLYFRLRERIRSGANRLRLVDPEVVEVTGAIARTEPVSAKEPQIAAAVDPTN